MFLKPQVEAKMKRKNDEAWMNVNIKSNDDNYNSKNNNNNII